MSGTMQNRLNRTWFNSTQDRKGIHRLFAEFLAYFDDHPEFAIIASGTAKVQTEATGNAPVAWKAWADSDGSGAVPFADNAWFVVAALKASADLSGGGTRQWQAKFQFTDTTGFDDCNVADNDYGYENVFQSLCVRFSPDGGWVGTGTLDFVAVTASDNLRVADFTRLTGSQDFQIHFIGDDDTMLWVAQSTQAVAAFPRYDIQRLGYLGETIRRNANHLKPELALIADMRHLGGWVLRKGSNEVATAIFSDPLYGGSSVPSFSLGADDTGVIRHMSWCGANRMSADYDLLWNGLADHWSGDAEFLAITVRQNHEEHNSILGQLRLISAAANYVDAGKLWGDGTRLSVGHATATRGGLAVPWPGSTTLPIF